MFGGVVPTNSLKNSAVSSMLPPIYQDILCTLNPCMTYKPMKTGIIPVATKEGRYVTSAILAQRSIYPFVLCPPVANIGYLPKM